MWFSIHLTFAIYLAAQIHISHPSLFRMDGVCKLRQSTPHTPTSLKSRSVCVRCWKNPLSDIYTTRTPSYFTFSLSFTLSPITVPPYTHLSLLTYLSLSRPKAPLHPSVVSRVSSGRLNSAMGRYCCRGNSDKLLKGNEGPRLLFASCSLFSTTHFTAHHDTQHTAHYWKQDNAQ